MERAKVLIDHFALVRVNLSLENCYFYPLLLT